tara:strand:+ start:297 stop:1082 length:786 start_codon:yes stop_codon:yes gene_type:complete
VFDMARVKGSKQYRMRVVPDRPLYTWAVLCAFTALLGFMAFLSYEYGRREGLALKDEVMRERDSARLELRDHARQIDAMRQHIADLEVGREVDEKATEEVLVTIEGLQNRIAELQEEIRFYKGVMLPNVDEKGLRIERLDILRTPDPNRVKYKLLLTQVVDKHDYVQGGVEINLLGRPEVLAFTSGDPGQVGAGAAEAAGSESSDPRTGSIRFRFRYFQNIDGELTLPDGFEPEEIIVVAQSSGRNAQKLERRFAYSLGDG